MVDINPAGSRGVDIEIIDAEVDALLTATADDGVERIAEEENSKLPKQAVLQRDGTVKLPLLFPVTLVYQIGTHGPRKEETYADLHFRRLNGADMVAIQETETGKSVVAIARSTKLHAGLMHRLHARMDAADIVACGKVIEHFLAGGQTTGR